MRTPTRTLATIVSVTSLTIGLASCSGEDSTSAGSAASTTPTSSASVSETPASTPTETATGTSADDGVAAFLERVKAGIGDSGTVHMEMKMSGALSTQASGDSEYGPDGQNARLSLRVPGLGDRELTLLLVDGDAYMAIPGMTPQGSYFKVPAGGGALAGMGDLSAGPTDSLAAFEAGLREVEDLGAEQIGGDEVEHYRLTLDGPKAVKALGGPEASAAPDTVRYDVWLDSEGRMRRIKYDLSGSTLVLDMSDWGKDVSISAPPKDKIVKAPLGM